MTNEANGASTQRYLLYIWSGVEAELHGPFSTDDQRVEAARALASEEDSVFRLNAVGPVELDSFGQREIEDG